MAKSVINDEINRGTVWKSSARGVSVIGAMKSYPTYSDFMLDSEKGAFAWVDDASEDPTVNSGGALYRIRQGGSIQKILETESMDQIFSFDVPWERLINKPYSTVDQIDQAVQNMHDHPNISLLTNLTGTPDALKTNGATIITEANMNTYLGKTLEEVIGQGAHAHPNLSLLNTVTFLNGRTRVNGIELANLSDITGPVVEYPVVLPSNIHGEKVLNMNEGKSYQFTGSSGYVTPVISNWQDGMKGTWYIYKGTSILWPKGAWKDGLNWCYDQYPEDISTVTTEGRFFVMDFKILQGNIFFNFVASNVILDKEEE